MVKCLIWGHPAGMRLDSKAHGHRAVSSAALKMWSGDPAFYPRENGSGEKKPRPQFQTLTLTWSFQPQSPHLENGHLGKMTLKTFPPFICSWWSEWQDVVKNGLNSIGGLALTLLVPFHVTFWLPIAHLTTGTEEAAMLPSMGSQRVGHDWLNNNILQQGIQLRCPSG